MKNPTSSPYWLALMYVKSSMHDNHHVHRHKWTRQAGMTKLSGPWKVPWCTPWNQTTPRYRTTTSQNLLTIPGGGGGTLRRETPLVFLPLGGGKLRCRDVLGLGSGRGSCLNPGEWGRLWSRRRWSKGRELDKSLRKGIDLWCWFQGHVVSWLALAVSWL